MSVGILNEDAIGFLGVSASTGVSSINVNAAATYCAFSFVLKSAKTLSTVRLYISETGALAAGEVQVDIYSDSAGTPGQPGTSLANVTNGGAISTGWTDFTGFSLALSAHTLYWIVVRNLNGTPASNYPTLRYSANSGGAQHLYASTSTWGSMKKSSTDSGSTWGGIATNIFPGLRLDFNDSTYAGLPIETGGADTTNTIYSTREMGTKFTSPANVRLRVTGVVMMIGKSGAPTGNARFRLYEGTTLVGTTQEIPLGNASSGSAYAAYFSSPLTLKANTSYRVVLSETTQSDTSSNRYQGYYITIDSNANSQALKPFGGSCQKTYYDGSSWTDTSGDFCPFGLILDFDGMFSPLGTDFAYT